MIVVRPLHNKYTFCRLDNTTYISYFKNFSKAKYYGIRGISTWAAGTGSFGIVKSAIQGVVVKYGKEKLAVILLTTGARASSQLLCFIKNATAVIEGAPKVHSICAFVAECFEDQSNLMLLPLDMVLFGQSVPLGEVGRFNVIGNFSNIFK